MDVTIQEFEVLSKAISEKRAEITELQAKKKIKDEELGGLETRFMNLLEQAGKHDYHSEVGTIYISERTSVKVPKDIDAKRQLFKYLHDKGIFNEMVSVNSQTLNAYFKAERAAEEEKGNFGFLLPGVGEPTVDLILGFRKK